MNRKLTCYLFFISFSTFQLTACGDDSEATPQQDAAIQVDVSPDTSPDTTPQPNPDTGPPPISFADPALEGCVRAALKKTEGVFSSEELATLTDLECEDAQIKDLEGLQRLSNLVHLSLWENAITKIDVLGELTQLTSLQLGQNQIQDISALSKLVKLKRLGLAQNQIDDLTALKELIELEWLNLDHNQIADASLVHLNALQQLKWLTLEKNALQKPQNVLSVPSGCEVYIQLSNAAQAADPLLRREQFLPSHGWLRGGHLSYAVGPTGTVRFSYQVQQHSYEVIEEFAGKIVLQGGELHYRVGQEDIVIGRTRPTLEMCSGGFASVCQLALSKKGPGAEAVAPRFKQTQPVITLSLNIQRTKPYASTPQAADMGLIPFVLASPHQFDAGSCLFMSNTGAMELLMNQHVAPALVAYQGDTDLSERYLMNASSYVPKSVLRYSITDAIYTYNQLGGALLNRDYPFTAGYIKKLSNGDLVPADPQDSNAEFSCKYNWIDELPSDWKHNLVKTPEVERTLIFVDPQKDEESVWRIVLMNDDVIERVKYELRSKNAPVVVVYNHYLYWHAVIVVGYDDEEDSDGCPMVKSSIKYFQQQGADGYVTALQNAINKDGGCLEKGVFYVRDSIEDGGAEEIDYQYNKDYNFTEKYSKRIIKHSYNWVKYLANHAYTIHRAAE